MNGNQQIDLTTIFNYMFLMVFIVMMFRMVDTALESPREKPVKMLGYGKPPPGYKPVYHSSPGTEKLEVEHHGGSWHIATEERQGWDLNKTDMPYYDNLLKNPEYFRRAKGVAGKIIWVSPENYMRMAAQVHGVPLHREYAALVGKTVNQYAHQMEQGYQFPLPVIDLAAGLEEGRHRAAAAQSLGHKKMPVLVVEKADYHSMSLPPEQGREYGTCYEDAWRFLIKTEEGDLVHGSVESKGKRIKHAWVELPTGFVWEPQTGRFIRMGDFDAAFKPQEEDRYSTTEAAIMAARTGNLGPWTEEERREFLPPHEGHSETAPDEWHLVGRAEITERITAGADVR